MIGFAAVKLLLILDPRSPRLYFCSFSNGHGELLPNVVEAKEVSGAVRRVGGD